MTATKRRAVASLTPAAEVALAVVSLATVAGMWRLFVDGSFFWPLTMHAVGAHVVAATCRRRGLPTLASAAITAAVAAVVLTWAHLGDTTTLGVPTGETFTAARERLDEAWRLFDEVKAPAPVLPGFLLAAGAALWAGAWLADMAAFRLWTSFEALVPSGTIFVFASLFAAERSRALAAAAWLGAALAFALLHRTARQHNSPSWLGSDPRLGTSSLLRVGGVLVVGAVGLALALGPNLPGADAAAIVAVRDLDDSGGSRQTVSPLVEIQGRLVNQADVELFTVRTEQRAYWRLTSLDDFDGDVWSSRGSFGEADGRLADAGDPPPGSVDVTQQVSVTGLAAIWLPAAFEPRAIEPGDAEVRWEAESSTLIVSTDHPSSDGLAYEVTSAVPTGLTADQLAGTGPAPADVVERNTGLPPGFPASVVAEAQEVVAGAVTPYEQARALQDYFRDGSFTYTLEVPPGHSDSAIEEFLFARRSGYCEQFAGTYAAMARAVGLPARVAVGFTPGVADPTDPALYRVRGEHAHAWPEVWIPGAGWTAFEPTPGRGAPNAAYTGVPESQDTAGPSTEPTTVPTTQVPAPDPAAPDQPAPTSAPPFPDERDPSTTPAGEQPVEDGTSWVERALVGLAALAAAAVAVALAGGAVAGWRVVRRWRRWSAASTADAKVRAAWADAVDAAGVVGLSPRAFETPVEFAGRAAPSVGTGAAELVQLAWLVEEADYAADAVSDAVAVEVAALTDAVRRSVHDRTTARERVLAAVDPRPPARRNRPSGPRPAGPRIQVRGV